MHGGDDRGKRAANDPGRERHRPRVAARPAGERCRGLRRASEAMLRKRRLPGGPARLPRKAKTRLLGKITRNMKSIFFEQTGGPEVLRFGDRPTPEPAKGEVLVKL